MGAKTVVGAEGVLPKHLCHASKAVGGVHSCAVHSTGAACLCSLRWRRRCGVLQPSSGNMYGRWQQRRRWRHLSLRLLLPLLLLPLLLRGSCGMERLDWPAQKKMVMVREMHWPGRFAPSQNRTMPAHAPMCSQQSCADAPHAARGSAKKLGPKVDALVRLYDNHRHSHGCALCSRLCKTSVHSQEGTRICPTTKQTTHARQL